MSASEGTFSFASTGDGGRAAGASTELVVPKLREEYSGVRLLLTDIRMVMLLLQEGRYRAVERFLGIPRQKSALVTIIAVAVLVEGAGNKARDAVDVPRPGLADSVIGAVAIRELVRAVGGSGSQETPNFGALIGLGVIAGFAAPVVKKSAQEARNGLHRAKAAFDRRYGHVVRQARRQADAARSAVASAVPGVKAQERPDDAAEAEPVAG
jgi:hypothetical protein